ncbi:MAG: metallopeptidase family protein [Planctomycetota bacterium]|nr:metallopeptidase family protein [Planctomycetota bacterium]
MERITRQEREQFDAILDEVVQSLHPDLLTLLEQAPLIVDDAPSDALLRELGLDPTEDDLCGLHTGIPLTQRSIESSGQPEDVIHIFRRGIIDEAGGFEPWEDDESHESVGGSEEVRHEITITILHEIGHHFGLDEEDLLKLGYG